MRIALLGSRGQLGRDLAPRLPGDVLTLARADLDLDTPGPVRPTLDRLRPDVLVNCAAYNLVDRAEEHPEEAFRVNAWAVAELARACADLGIRFVHFGTDYVFGLDADRREPLPEDAPPGPVSQYGMSKLAGEYAARAHAPDHLVIRTCGLYGAWGSGGKGTNFVETMLKLAGQGRPLKVVDDQRCTPTYTVDLAERAAGWIAGGERGVVHMTNAGDCTWYELACEAFRLAGVTADVAPTTSAAYGAKAERPAYSVLANDRLRAAGQAMRPWREALAAYLAERTARNS